MAGPPGAHRELHLDRAARSRSCARTAAAPADDPSRDRARPAPAATSRRADVPFSGSAGAAVRPAGEAPRSPPRAAAPSSRRAGPGPARASREASPRQRRGAARVARRRVPGWRGRTAPRGRGRTGPAPRWSVRACCCSAPASPLAGPEPAARRSAARKAAAGGGGRRRGRRRCRGRGALAGRSGLGGRCARGQRLRGAPEPQRCRARRPAVRSRPATRCGGRHPAAGRPCPRLSSLRGRSRPGPGTTRVTSAASAAKRQVRRAASRALVHGASPSTTCASATRPSPSSVTAATAVAGPLASWGKGGTDSLAQLRDPFLPRDLGQLHGEGDRHREAHAHRLAVHLRHLVLPLPGGGQRRPRRGRGRCGRSLASRDLALPCR